MTYAIEAYNITDGKAHKAFFESPTGGEGIKRDRWLVKAPEQAVEVLDSLTTVDVALVRAVSNGRILMHQTIERDYSTLDRWAIERLISDYPATTPVGAIVATE